MTIPKIGSRFTLTELPHVVWEVEKIFELDEQIKAVSEGKNCRQIIVLDETQCSKLNWLKPEVPKLTKEQAEKILNIAVASKNFSGVSTETFREFHEAIDAITE